MKLALLGSTGRMGEAVQAAAGALGHDIVSAFDLDTLPKGEAFQRAVASADVVLEFTQPNAVLPNIEQVAQAGKPMVVGTTGWYEALDQAKGIVSRHGTGLVWGANFSVGALLLARLTRDTSTFLNDFPDFDPYVLEHHHRGKVDSPSGTGKRLAESIKETLDRKARIQTGSPSGPIAPEAVHLSSVRAGSAFGSHTVGFDAPGETLELAHTARGREAFAVGALQAARWIRARTGFFEFPEIFQQVTEE